MHTKVWLIITCLIYSAPAWAGLELFDLQDVCRVTLKSGKTIEGIVLVGTGGRETNYDTNGFLLVVNKGTEVPVLFTADFISLEPSTGKVATTTAISGYGEWFRNPTVYYLHDITSRRYHSDFQQTAVTTAIVPVTGTTTSLLRRDIIHHLEYELLDAVPVYPRVPPEVYLTDPKVSVKPVLIKTADIQKFELLWAPSAKWIEQIRQAEVAWMKKNMGEAGEDVDTGEWGPPGWFHAMERTEYIRTLFKPWKF